MAQSAVNQCRKISCGQMAGKIWVNSMYALIFSFQLKIFEELLPSVSVVAAGHPAQHFLVQSGLIRAANAEASAPWRRFVPEAVLSSEQ